MKTLPTCLSTVLPFGNIPLPASGAKEFENEQAGLGRDGWPFDRFIATETESGRFEPPEAAVEAGLLLLEAERAKYANLRKALREGEESGSPIAFDPEEFKPRLHKRHM